MEIPINVAVDYTALQFAQANGLTHPTGRTSWEFNNTSVVPTGLTVTFTKLSGTPTAVGSWTVNVKAVDAYYSAIETFPVTLAVVDPNAPAPEPEPEPVPEPEPEPEPEFPQDPLAARVAAHIGRRGDADTIQQATDHLTTIRAFVWGYTRGRGFLNRNIDVPDAAVEAVIVSACTRLTANPEQVTTYTAGDYSERGATLQGFILPELAVLNGYRRRAA